MSRKHDFRQLHFPWSPRYTISSKAAADLLGVSVKTVCRMIADGSLPAEKSCPDHRTSAWRIKFEAVESKVSLIDGRITMETAADVLDVSKPTIKEMIKSGELSAVKLRNADRSTWLISGESLLQHLGRIRAMDRTEL